MSDQTGSVQGQEPQEVTHVGDLEVSAINEALAKHYGSEVTFSDLDSSRNIASEYEELKTKYSQAQLELTNNRFASPLVAKLDEMARNESSVQEMVKYMGLQNLNVAEMNDMDLLKTWKSLERPQYSGQDVDDWFNATYPPLADDAGDYEKRTRAIKIKEDAQGAASFINEQIVSAENPESVKLREAEAAKMEEAMTNYNTQVSSLMKEVKSIPYKVEEESFSFGFDFSIPENPEISERIQKAVVEQALAKGVSFDEKGRGEIKDMLSTAYKALYHNDIIKAIVNDAYASLYKQAVVNNGNPNPVTSGSGGSSNPSPKVRSTVVEKGGRSFV